MPYIHKDDRQYYQLPLEVAKSLNTPGQLNYLITQAVIAYLSNNGECYQTYNDIVGALECAKQELYRRKIATYENLKVQENGDVF